MQKTIANILILISLVIMFIYGIKRSNNFINISKIIVDHFKIFSGAIIHIVILYIVPASTSVGIALIYKFSSSMIEAIMVVISVVISALLAFQGAIMNLEKKEMSKRKQEILIETNSSINFTVLINISLVFVMLIYILLNNEILKYIFTGIISYALMITFLTILIIVKRVRVLLNEN